MSKESGSKTYTRRRFIKDAILLAGAATASFAGLQCMQNEKSLRTSEKQPVKPTPTPSAPTKTPQIW